jgi:hypothetical protein
MLHKVQSPCSKYNSVNVPKLNLPDSRPQEESKIDGRRAGGREGGSGVWRESNGLRRTRKTRWPTIRANKNNKRQDKVPRAQEDRRGESARRDSPTS